MSQVHVPSPAILAKSDGAEKIGYGASTVKAKLDSLDSDKAPLASPALAGNPTAPTQNQSNDNTRLATTAFVHTAVGYKNADTMADLVGATQAGYVFLRGFHSVGDGGYGLFKWESAENQANHDGGTIIDPDNTADLAVWNAAAKTTWFTAGSGTGCWVRQDIEYLNVKWFGAKGDNTEDDTKSLQGAFDAFEQGWWDNSGIRYQRGYVYAPAGIYLIDPTVGVLVRDHLEWKGAGVGSTMIKASSSSGGSLIKRDYTLGTGPHDRVNHVVISHIRGIVTGTNQIIFDLQHVGRCEVHHVLGTTQDREDEYNNANQKHYAGSALLKIGVGDSVANGYVNGSDVFKAHHFEAVFMDYGVLSAGNANQKAPEDIVLSDFEISDCRQPIVFNASAGMIGSIARGVVQRWGKDATDQATSLPATDGYGVDLVSNKYIVKEMYFESDSAFAACITRSGNNTIVDTSTWNRYGTTVTLHADSATGTVTR